MNRKIKIGIAILGGISSLGTTIGLGLIIQNRANVVDKTFKKVSFKGNNFASKSEVLQYIKNNMSELEKQEGELVFSINMGNDKKDFGTYKDAYEYAMNHISRMEVYLIPDSKIDPINKTISRSEFVIKKTIYKINKDTNKMEIDKEATDKADNGNKFYAFQKSKHFNDKSSSSDKTKHGYLLISANASPEEIKKTREKAASTYIQMHSAYLFDGVYFPTKNDVKSYIYSNLNGVHKFESSLKAGNFKQLTFKNGTSINFDEVDAKSLEKNEDFKNIVLASSTPFFRYKTSQGKDEYIEINNQNISTIGSHMSEEALPYINVVSNYDKVTNIVDMDNTIKNGNVYGPYFNKTGMSYDGIDDISNWKRTKDDKSPNANGDLVETLILKSTMNYILKSKGFNSPLDLVKNITIAKNGPTLYEYLLEGSDFKDKDKHGRDYLKKLNDLVITISKGRRYNHLDAIIAMYKSILDNMLNSRENSTAIIKVAEYFNSMSVLLDSLLQLFLLPFISKNIDDKNSDFRINYFESAFGFYKKNENGKGIDIQKDEYSYYRKLLGFKEDNNNSNDNGKNIFQLIKAAMGLHSLSMKSLISNQRGYDDWKSRAIQSIKAKSFIRKLGFQKSKSKSNLWDFSFATSSSGAKGDEVSGIWNNIDGISSKGIKIGSIIISKYSIHNNFSEYITNIHNKYIASYVNKFKNAISYNTNIYKDHEKQVNGKKAIIKAQTYEQGKTEATFALNTFSFIDINTSDLASGNFATTADKEKNLTDLVKNAIKPLEERIKSFAINVGTFVANAAMGIKTASAMAETSIVKQEFSKSIHISSSNKISISKRLEFASAKRSRSYVNSSWIKSQNISVKKTAKTSIQITKTKVKKTGVEQVKDILGSDTKYSPEEKSSIAEALSSAYSAPFGAIFGENAGKAVKLLLDIGIGIAKNVIPGVSFIFNIIDSFSTSETQVFYYTQNPSDDNYYWDGGKVNYSWWGLSADQVFSIKDLKMIDPPVIVSGHSAGNKGFYYGNKYHDGLSALKHEFASKLVKDTLSVSRLELLSKPQDDIVWKSGITGADLSEDYFEKLCTILDNSAKLATNTNIPKSLYKMVDGSFTTNENTAKESAIKSLLARLKPILVLQLPKIDEFGNLKVNNNFHLPYPYYQYSKLTSGKNKNQSEEFQNIILNPNINIPTKTSDIEISNITREALGNMASQKYASGQEKLKKVISMYTSNFYIPVKKIIWQDANNYSKRYFEDLNNYWSEHTKTIYNFIDSEGKTNYFTERAMAIKKLLSNNNYNIYKKTLGHPTTSYKFDEILFNSINKIYNYVLEQNDKKGANHE